MNCFRPCVAAIALLNFLCSHAWGAGVSPQKPNVIVVLTDDQGYGDLSCTGNPVLKTPNMDQLAAEGVQLSNFHVDSYCTPTRSALVTGRYAHRVGGWGTTSGRNLLRDGGRSHGFSNSQLSTLTLNRCGAAVQVRQQSGRLSKPRPMQI